MTGKPNPFGRDTIKMVSGSPEKDWVKRMAAGLPMVAMLAVATVFQPVALSGWQWFNNVITTDADIRARIEREVFNSSKMSRSLKEYFPQEYEAMIETMIVVDRKHLSSPEKMQKGAEFVASIKKQYAANVQMASFDSLRQLMRSSLRLYEFVRDKFGHQACNSMATGGGLALMNAVGAQNIKDKDFLSLMDESTSYLFTIAGEGMKLQMQHAPPTDADWQAVGETLIANGMVQDDFDLMTTPQPHMDDPRLCDVTINWIDGISRMDNDAGKRVIPYVAGAMAAQ